MTGTPLVAVSPSYWQQTLFAVVAIVALVPALSIVIVAVRRIVFEPRARGHVWPEGSGWGGWSRLPAEFAVDLTRITVDETSHERDLRDVLCAMRVGLWFMAIAVIPLSSGLVAARLGLGLFVLPVVAALDALLASVGGPSRESRTKASVRLQAATSLAAACVLGLAAAVVAAQWTSASLVAVAHAQGSFALFGVAGFGAPTILVQAPMAIIALCAMQVVLVAEPVEWRSSGPRGVVDRIRRGVAVVAVSGWTAVVLLGGHATPWAVANDGVRHVVGAALVLTKTMLVAGVFAWSSARWPRVDPTTVQRLVVAGVVTALLSFAWIGLARHVV